MPDRQHDVVRGLGEARSPRDIAALLAGDVVAVCDGGGAVLVPSGVVRGVADGARLVALLLDGELTVESVNGRAGLALRRAGRVVAVIGVQTAGAEITALWIVLNPAKLRGWHRR